MSKKIFIFLVVVLTLATASATIFKAAIVRATSGLSDVLFLNGGDFNGTTLTFAPTSTGATITATAYSGNATTSNFAASASSATNAGSASTATWATYISAPDGDRNAATKLPTTTGHGVRFDFVGAGSAGTLGNYAGVMTYAPWDGTTASTGDASYQLAFGSTATNGGGIPMLNIRKGIDSTWNSWYTILHSGNFNSWAPTLTGGGAYGTWGINITGSAGSAGSATYANNANSVFYLANTGGGQNMGVTGNTGFDLRASKYDFGYNNGQTGAFTYWGGSTSAAFSVTNGGVGYFSGNVSATSFSGLGTGLTGTAASLNIGGNATTATTAGNANTLGGQPGSYYDQRVYTSNSNYLGGYYVSGGNEKPNDTIFGPGKLKVAMLSGSNLGYGGPWNDVLWLSTYTGGDVKNSFALVSDKYSDNVWISKQAFDSASWGTGRLIMTSGNIGSQSVNYANSAGSATYANNANSVFYLANTGGGQNMGVTGNSGFDLRAGKYDFGYNNGQTGAFTYWGGSTSAAFSVTSGGVGYFSGNVSVSGTITSGSKITAGTFDPVYTINGKHYATYLSGMTGVKEETSDVLALDCAAGTCSKTIDFKTLPVASDLWLFAKATNLVNNFSALTVLVTPSFDGRVWYEKNAVAKTLTVKAVLADKVSEPVEVSYRLTAPRFDSASWPNTSSEKTEGFNLDKLIK